MIPITDQELAALRADPLLSADVLRLVETIEVERQVRRSTEDLLVVHDKKLERISDEVDRLGKQALAHAARAITALDQRDRAIDERDALARDHAEALREVQVLQRKCAELAGEVERWRGRAGDPSTWGTTGRIGDLSRARELLTTIHRDLGYGGDRYATRKAEREAAIAALLPIVDRMVGLSRKNFADLAPPRCAICISPLVDGACAAHGVAGVKPAGGDDHATGWLAVDEYEAVNLQWLLRVAREIGLDTGDWLGQLLRKLEWHVVDRQPNSSPRDTAVRLDLFARERVKRLQPGGAQ